MKRREATCSRGDCGADRKGPAFWHRGQLRIRLISSHLFIFTQRFAAYRDNTARHPYRDIGEGDPRGVIRLTCGSH